MRMSEELFFEKLNRGELQASDIAECLGRNYAMDRAIAGSSGVSEDTLERLAKSHDPGTRHQVILNVTTPAASLIDLAAEFPLEFFSHPMLDFMILEDPHLLNKLKPGVLKEFLKDPACPESFLVWACRFGNKTDQLEILKRSDLKVEWLKFIAQGAHPKPAERAMDRLIEMGEEW